MANLSSLYGYDDPTFTAIIDATGVAISDMNNVNSQVQNIRGYLPVANKSTSGTLLAARIDDWSYEFSRVIQALDALKEKAEFVRRHNVDTSYQTTEASRTGD